MEENRIFQEQVKEVSVVDGKKPLDVAALVLGIVAVVFALLSPIVTYICGIIGLVFAIKHRKTKRTTAALVLCIVGLVCGVASHIYAVIQLMAVMESMLG